MERAGRMSGSGQMLLFIHNNPDPLVGMESGWSGPDGCPDQGRCSSPPDLVNKIDFKIFFFYLFILKRVFLILR